MPRKEREEFGVIAPALLWQHYLEQLPMVAALLWEDGNAEDAAAHAGELIEECFKEAERLQRP